MTIDSFGKGELSILAPASRAVAVTPNDSADLTEVSRAVYIGAAGNVRVILNNDSATVDFVAVPSGGRLDIRAKRIYATGTTATNIVALY